MKKKILGGVLSKNGIIAAISVCGILLLIGLNLLLTYFGVQKTIFIDTTPEGLYTLTKAFKEECAFIDRDLDEDKKVEITFCSDPDALLDSTVTKVVYLMALKMQNHFDNVDVKTVNVTFNPTAVSKYRPTSLTTINPTDVIVSYGDRYIVVNSSSFWTIASGENKLFSYNGEYKMASLIMSVTAKNRPVAYFTSGHGETFYDVNSPESEGSISSAALFDLLTERGLEVRTIDLTEAKEIPDDCVLLIINDPKTDFSPDESRLNSFGYVSPIEVIDRYLVRDYGSVMVAKDYETALPNLESFLYEWGFDFSSSLVKDDSSLLDRTGEFTKIPGVYNSDENSYGYMLYSEFVNLASAPLTVFSNTGYLSCSYGNGVEIPEDGAYSVTRRYEPLFFSTSASKAYEKNGLGGTYTDIEREGMLHLAAVSTRTELDDYTVEYRYSDVFCAASGDFFSNELLGNASYANHQIVSVLTENLIRTEEYASSALGGTSLNFDNVGGKELQSTEMLETSVLGYDPIIGEEYVVSRGLDEGSRTVLTVIILIPALAAAIAGIAVCIKRRYL